MKDASKFISLMHQAVAEFSAQHFGLSIDLMCSAFEGLKLTKLQMSDALYNGVFDAVDMVYLMVENLPVLEQNTYTQNTIQQLKIALEDLSSQELFSFQEKLDDFYQLIKGIQVGFSFFRNNDLPLNQLELGLSFGLNQDDFIELYKSKNSPQIDWLIEEFNACFNQQKVSAVASQNNINLLIQKEDYQAAILALEEMIITFPETQKTAFYQLAELYFDQKKYQKATDAYMKSVVMGTPKSTVIANLKFACNQLIQQSKTSAERGYWQEFFDHVLMC